MLTINTPPPAAALYPIERTRSAVWLPICISRPRDIHDPGYQSEWPGFQTTPGFFARFVGCHGPAGICQAISGFSRVGSIRRRWRRETRNVLERALRAP